VDLSEPRTHRRGVSGRPRVAAYSAALRARLGRHRWFWAATALVVLFASLGMGQATGVTDVRGTVIRLFSPEGTLVVEGDDPGVNETVDGSDVVITGARAKEIRLKAGQYKAEASMDGKLVRQELVTVSRNGRQVVQISKKADLTPLKGLALDHLVLDYRPEDEKLLRSPPWLKAINRKPAAKFWKVVSGK
jgi:hypothetical protein